MEGHQRSLPKPAVPRTSSAQLSGLSVGVQTSPRLGRRCFRCFVSFSFYFKILSDETKATGQLPGSQPLTHMLPRARGTKEECSSVPRLGPGGGSGPWRGSSAWVPNDSGTCQQTDRQDGEAERFEAVLGEEPGREVQRAQVQARCRRSRYPRSALRGPAAALPGSGAQCGQRPQVQAGAGECLVTVALRIPESKVRAAADFACPAFTPLSAQGILVLTRRFASPALSFLPSHCAAVDT